MDPNETLQHIRDLLARLNDQRYEGDDWQEDAQELAYYVAELDVWLTRHGFLPTDWQR
jgi:hypothetical protein